MGVFLNQRGKTSAELLQFRIGRILLKKTTMDDETFEISQESEKVGFEVLFEISGLSRQTLLQIREAGILPCKNFQNAATFATKRTGE